MLSLGYPQDIVPFLTNCSYNHHNHHTTTMLEPTLNCILSNNEIHSMDSMEGVSFSPPGTPLISSSTKSTTIATTTVLSSKNISSKLATISDRSNFESMDLFVAAVNEVFLKKERQEINAAQLKTEIQNLFNRVDLSTSEINKYTFWDANKPYTRNLVALNGKHFTLLVLCWNVNKESKVHNHPGEGCYMKTLRGCVRETRYEVDAQQQLKQTTVKFLAEGQCKYN